MMSHYVVVHMYDACMCSVPRPRKKKESYTWRKTYPHIRISSKEVTLEAATIPRGILKMQDKTCLGRYGNSTPLGILSSPPSYRIQGLFDIRHATAAKPRTRIGWIPVELWQGKGFATMISRGGRSWNDLPITPGYRG